MKTKPSGARRIAHMGDIHLSVKERAESLHCYEFALNAAVSRKVDAIAIAGDMWDLTFRNDEISPLVPALRMTREAARHAPIVMIKGNDYHDAPGSLDVFREISDIEHPIHVVSAGPEFVTIGGINWYCIPAVNKSSVMQFLASSDQDATDAAAGNVLKQIVLGACPHFLPADPFDMPRVTMYHGMVLGCRLDNGQDFIGGDILISAFDLEQSGADYVLLAHVHGYQKLGTKCYYSGSTRHCNYGEHGKKHMLIVDVWRGGYEIVEEVELPSRAKVTIEGEFDGAAYTFAGLDLFTDGLGGADVKLRMRMTPEAAKTFSEMDAERSILVAGGAHSVRIERIIIPTERVRCAEITETRQLRDKVAAWGGATGTEIPAGVLDKADVLEGGVACA